MSGPVEASALAHAYLSGPALSLDLDAVRASIVSDFARLPFRVRYTDLDPYPGAEAMRAEVLATRTLWIWAGGTPAPYLGAAVNLMARAVHDAVHVTRGIGFGLGGEWLAARAHASERPALAEFYASEVLGQAAAYRADGVFPAQRLAAGLSRYL